MSLDYRYYEWEDRLYRAPRKDPRQMEKLNQITKQWERYLGDYARVILEASVVPEPR